VISNEAERRKYITDIAQSINKKVLKTQQLLTSRSRDFLNKFQNTFSFFKRTPQENVSPEENIDATLKAILQACTDVESEVAEAHFLETINMHIEMLNTTSPLLTDLNKQITINTLIGNIQAKLQPLVEHEKPKDTQLVLPVFQEKLTQVFCNPISGDAVKINYPGYTGKISKDAFNTILKVKVQPFQDGLFGGNYVARLTIAELNALQAVLADEAEFSVEEIIPVTTTNLRERITC